MVWAVKWTARDTEILRFPAKQMMLSTKTYYEKSGFPVWETVKFELQIHTLISPNQIMYMQLTLPSQMNYLLETFKILIFAVRKHIFFFLVVSSTENKTIWLILLHSSHKLWSELSLPCFWLEVKLIQSLFYKSN